MSEEKKQPVYKDRIGNLSVAIWANEKDGKTNYSAGLVQSYKDKDGQWQEARINLWHPDLLNGAKLLERAEDFIASQQ